MNPIDPLYKYKKYAYDVLSGEEVAGQYVKKACERYLAWFDRKDIVFRPDKADSFIDFCRHLKHYQGRFRGRPFELTDCQKFIAYNIFGWYYPQKCDSEGNPLPLQRVTKNVLIEVSRKFGKTFFIAALNLYCLVADGEYGGEVDVVANSAKQAKILFDMAKHCCHDIDPKNKHFIRLRDVIKFPKTDSIMQVLASDTMNLDGYNSSVATLDEIHMMKTSELYDVLKSSQGMRDNPLTICITTAGFLLTGFAYQYRKTCIDILYGLVNDDSQFAFICELDEADQWDDKRVWKKANPHIGITVKEDYIEEEINRAKANPTLIKSVKTKLLNIWVPDGIDTWISDEYIVKSSKEIPWEFFQDRICYIGIDLSSVSDLTVATWMTKDTEEQTYYFKSKVYLPDETVRTSPNATLYQQWMRMGYLTVTPGNVTDYDYILQDILQLQSTGITIESIGYDQYNSTQFAINATSAGLPMQPFPQSLVSFNRPTKEFERLIRQGRIVIDNNPITRWCFANAVLKSDQNNNVKCVKRGGPTSLDKIDATITHVEALGTYLNSDNAKYESTDMNV